jgi:uncharacterized membrane protein
MDEAAALIALLILLIALAGWVLGVVAFFMALRRRSAEARLRETVEELEGRLSLLEEGISAPEEFPLEVVEEAPPAAAAPAEPAAAPKAEEVAPELPPPARPLAWDWSRFEELAGRQWLTWAGVLVLLCAAGFFVKYAFDHDWIGPTARVLLGIVAGIGLLTGGERVLRRGMTALGQGLLGGGLALLYLSLFAAFSLYELIPQPAAFGAMVLVTAGGMALAVLHDALSISFLAVLGGLLTPVLLSTGEDARDALFGYLVVLDAGVLGVALFRRWRALDVLAFAGTAFLFGNWFAAFYEPETMLPALGWLAALYAIFLVLPFANHLRFHTPIPLERFALALANATLAFICAYLILHEQHEAALGFVALGMAACYTVLGAQTRKRVGQDARAVFGFIALAVVFLTLAVPLHLGLHGITLAWAAEGPVLVYLGYRYRYEPARLAGGVALLLATFRLFAVHWPLHGALFRPFLNASFGSAISVPVAAAGAAIVHQLRSDQAHRRDRMGKLLCALLLGGLLGLVVLTGEIGGWFERTDRRFLGQAALAALWAAGAAAYLLGGLRMRSLPARVAGIPVLLIAMARMAGLYAGDAPVPADYLPVSNARFVAGVVVVWAVFAYPLLLSLRREICPPKEQRAGRLLFWLGIGALLYLLSAEAYTSCMEAVIPAEKARWSALMSVSVVWGVYAAGLLAVGFRRRRRPLRLAGLGLFGATALKLVLVDIAGVKQAYRIIAFLVLGLLMIGAAYAYHWVEKRMAATAQGEP